ncbi:preprotein translocase subunit SecA [Wukongibacter baidiensis]
MIKIQINRLLREIKKKDFGNLHDEDLRAKFKLEREKYIQTQDIDKSLVNTFAIVAEVFKRVIKIDPYDEQIMCAVAMHRGYLSEMKTGEGKTIAAVFTAILNSLKGQVHIVTVNEYLAKRDYENMRYIYEFLGVSCIANSDDISKKSEIYTSDIIYTSSSELIFDYLKNEIDHKYSFGKLDLAIIDEIDFVLLDNANSSFSVSADTSNVKLKNLNIYIAMKSIFGGLSGGEIPNKTSGLLNEGYIESLGLDYVYDKYEKTVHITKKGLKKVEDIFGIDSITESPSLYRALLLTIEAHVFFKRDSDYLVRDGKINLINRANGRIMKNSKKEFGFHQALEIKEGLKVSAINSFENRISYQVFFSKYEYLTGMSGTLKNAEDEFVELFGTPIFSVPTHRNQQRIDYKDMIFRTKERKIECLLDNINRLNKKGQPILIITENEKESYEIYELVKGLKVNILSANNLEEEERIVNECGKSGAITISTNMAGRGTDVKLDDKAIEAGGLFIISLNKFESRRIDNQVRGRAGRQGEIGYSIFLVSLEDTIFENLEISVLSKYKGLDDKGLYSQKTQEKLRKTLKGLQRKTGSMAFKLRKFNFYLDRIIEDYKKFIFSYSKNRNIVDVFNEVIEKEMPCLESKRENVVFLGGKVTEDTCIKEFIGLKEEEILRKINSFSKDLSNSLVKEIINKVTRETWKDLHIELDNLKHDIVIRGDDLSKVTQEYIKESDVIIKNYLRYVNLKTVDMFLRAEIKDRGNTDNNSLTA